MVSCIQPRLIPGGVVGLAALDRRVFQRRCQPQLLVPTQRFHKAVVLDAIRFRSYASEGLAKVPTMILCETRGLQLFWVIRGAVTWKSVEVTVRRRRSRPDLISHDEYPRSYSGKATTCRKRSDNVPAIERSASKPRGNDASASIEAERAQG